MNDSTTTNEAGMLAHIDDLEDTNVNLRQLIADMLFECEGDFSPEILNRARSAAGTLPACTCTQRLYGVEHGVNCPLREREESY